MLAVLDMFFSSKTSTAVMSKITPFQFVAAALFTILAVTNISYALSYYDVLRQLADAKIWNQRGWIGCIGTGPDAYLLVKNITFDSAQSWVNFWPIYENNPCVKDQPMGR